MGNDINLVIWKSSKRCPKLPMHPFYRPRSANAKWAQEAYQIHPAIFYRDDPTFCLLLQYGSNWALPPCPCSNAMNKHHDSVGHWRRPFNFQLFAWEVASCDGSFRYAPEVGCGLGEVLTKVVAKIETRHSIGLTGLCSFSQV